MATELAPDDAPGQHSVMIEQNRLSDVLDAKPRSQGPHAKAKEGAVEKLPKSSSSAKENRSVSVAKVRKRTKTGCLTCRRRRIKCGEERPMCNNCVKSKRNCEGYTPRVIFKDPLGAYRAPGGTARDTGIHFQPITSYNGAEVQQRLLQPRSRGQMPPPVIASQPTQNASGLWTGIAQPARMPMYRDGSPMRPAIFEGPLYTRGDLPPRMLQQMARPECSLDASPVTPERDVLGSRAPGVSSQHHGVYPADPDSGIDVSYPGLPSDWSYGSASSATGPLNLHYVAGSHDQPRASEGQAPDPSQPNTTLPYPVDNCPPPTSWQHAETNSGASQHWSSHLPPTVPNQYGPIRGLRDGEHASTAVSYGGSGYHSSDGNYASFENTSQASGNFHKMKETNQYDPTLPADYDPSMEGLDDDFYDVTSDEEEASGDLIMSDATASQLGLMLAPAAGQGREGFRSLTNFLNEPNVLSTYRPSYAASPLMDPETARVFCHYVTATAPTLSIHNRHAVNPSVRMFMGEPVPAYQRSLFTYTLPMMALSNQGLLHAQLALASLHIAKLQQTPPTPSLKHYHYALRRVAKAVGHPTKRREIATLAATLLLGFFEVTTAEHNKWNSHLAGARELILEIDFVGMTERINAYKAETKATAKGNIYDYRQVQHDRGQRRMSFDILRTDKEIDETLINILIGFKTKFNEYGHVIDPSEPNSYNLRPLSPKEVENFEIQCDLFWWYAKQDMYQSLISGNRLLWSHCPPRAPVGRLDAVYGSMDHLVLLFARLTDWTARDLARKIKVQKKAEQEMNMLMSQQSSHWSPNRGSQTMSTGQQPAAHPPPMYGMVPAPPHVHLPPGFDQSRQDHHEANQVIVQDAELEEATHAAEREWADICAALDILEEALGPDFQPLSSDLMTPLSTPFGPAIYHRTYSIACVWSLLFTARIYATRVAPAMPPAAMAAAGIAAPATAHWANSIGRISGGLQPLSSTAPLNPSHGAALMDSSMGLFHAGVQFRDPAQRGWTITKLRNVARMTGWQTSALIASGCERAWMAAAAGGKGPPYSRTMNASAKDDRVSGRSRDPNPGPPKDNNDRRFITMNPGTRVYWAMGILSAEEDMEQLKLD
ncbi:MAG: hypothetical protein LQ352_004951 [Teloschistes flavicans]|nr:MAG: hypothetical protein LQ352_004951 [Teloschistes flavicans]